MGAPTVPITSILPDEGWAPLLEIIVREAPARSIIEVKTVGMQALAARMLHDVGQQGVTVVLRPPRVAPLPPALTPYQRNIRPSGRDGLPGEPEGGNNRPVVQLTSEQRPSP